MFGATRPRMTVGKYERCRDLTPNIGQRLGGADRDRTGDPLLAKQVLSQLSYSPIPEEVVGLGRVELPTSPLSGVRSSQLSYRPGLGPACLLESRVSGWRAPCRASRDARAEQVHRKALE
jgi:hypothetical protein